ncbi:MAG: response regulator [Prolixibacteraceae bacterium]|nr:response regulator [Prolixibacteraceae bacterium]
MQNTKNPLIYIVEDSIVYKDLIVGHLQSKKFSNIKTFKKGEECLKELDKKPDVIVLDYSIDDMSGLELMRKVKEINPDIDFIFLSGQNDVEVAIKIMKLGAFDYVIKNEKAPARLVKAIEQAMVVTKHKKLQKGFSIGVVGFFIMLFLIIMLIIMIMIIFKL